MTGWSISGPPVLGRSCGSCKACCTWTPVESLAKLAGQRCIHLFHKGCHIYAGRPAECRAWSCGWLYQPETAGLRRPDLSGYAIDPMPADFLSDGRPAKAIQVWQDPARPDAHRDPALRAYLLVMAEKHWMPALIRPATPQQSTSIFLAPPIMTAERKWIEKTFDVISERAMAEKMLAAIDREARLLP